VKLSEGRGQFLVVENISGAILSYVNRYIPVKYRFFEDEKWYVHKDYMLPLAKLGYEKLGHIDYSELTPSAQMDIASAKANWRRGIDTEPLIVVEPDPYETLFLTPDAPDYILEAVWKSMIAKHHPDKGGDPERFLETKKAYERIKERNAKGHS
jgi:hypothetical protein